VFICTPCQSIMFLKFRLNSRLSLSSLFRRFSKLQATYVQLSPTQRFTVWVVEPTVPNLSHSDSNIANLVVWIPDLACPPIYNRKEERIHGFGIPECFPDCGSHLNTVWHDGPEVIDMKKRRSISGPTLLDCSKINKNYLSSDMVIRAFKFK
jgi:hypothetical protein